MDGRARKALVPLLGVAVALPVVLDEAAVFDVGLVLIFATAVMGLHVLVNWAGQLSLAHAAMVGVPALATAKLAADHGLSPVLLLPVGALIGAALGALVALPVLRVRGLYVTIVTLAAGLAVDRFLFTRSWLVGSGSLSVPVPRLGSFTLRSSRELYPVLLVVFGVAALGLRSLHRSKTARALWRLRSDPQAAMAGGIARGPYLLLAYVLGGGYAGLSGSLFPLWVGSLSAASFPLSLSFTYLIAAVLAGGGGLAGVLGAAVLLEGGRLLVSGGEALIAYGGPIALILVLTIAPGGLHRLGRSRRRPDVLTEGVAAPDASVVRDGPG